MPHAPTSYYKFVDKCVKYKIRSLESCFLGIAEICLEISGAFQKLGACVSVRPNKEVLEVLQGSSVIND